jgi:pimeloyl-ACP methyl ester carboxylesterase
MRLSDGRTLSVHDTGAGGEAITIVWHHGSPQTGGLLAPLVSAAERRGIRLVSFGRASYGGSTALPGRDIASVAADVRELADELGLATFAVMGASGGGPHALACAALLPGRVTGAVGLASVAPFTTEYDWFAGMADEGSLRAALAGKRASYEGEFVEESFIARDYEALAGEWAALGDDVQVASRDGDEGIIADDDAFVAPWGFDVSDIAVPVLIAQGARDRVIPASHGLALAAAIPTAELWLRPDDGHISILNEIPAAMDWLLERA